MSTTHCASVVQNKDMKFIVLLILKSYIESLWTFLKIWNIVSKPAQILVSAWMTIHLCSNELLGVSKMYKNISLKNTWKIGFNIEKKKIGNVIKILHWSQENNVHVLKWVCSQWKSIAYLNLHLQMLFEVG